MTKKQGVTFLAEGLKSDLVRNALDGVKKDLDLGLPKKGDWPGDVVFAKALLKKIDAATTPTIDLTFTELGFLMCVAQDANVEYATLAAQIVR